MGQSIIFDTLSFFSFGFNNKVNFVNFVIKSKRKKRQGIKNDTLSHKVIPKKKAKKNPSEINH